MSYQREVSMDEQTNLTKTASIQSQSELHPTSLSSTDTSSAQHPSSSIDTQQLTSSSKKKRLILFTGVIIVSIFLISSLIYIKGTLTRIQKLGMTQQPKTNSTQPIQFSKPKRTLEKEKAVIVDTADSINIQKKATEASYQ